VFASLTRRHFLEVKPSVSWGTLVLLTLDFLRQQGYRAESGLIYQGNRFLNAPEADRLANSVGLVYAERMVEALSKEIGSEEKVKPNREENKKWQQIGKAGRLFAPVNCWA
jgi:hypothetical protein